MIALVTDSNSLVPADLRDRFAVTVVPLTVVVDGEPHAEGVDLTTAAFYERLAAGAEVSTAAPAPGALLGAYERAAASGANAILSIHIGSNTSGTVGSARVAAASSPIPVEIIDTGTASFPVGCCVWAAGAALDRGGSLQEAAAAAQAVSRVIGNVFVVGALELARRGGRLQPGVEPGTGVPVLALRDGTMDVLGHAEDLEGAVDAMMVEFERAASGQSMRVGVGDASAPELADELAARLIARPETAELVRYEVGPSVAAHSGLGTAGAVYFPAGLVGP
ncbi:MAG TPA: DegV family protein [Acidimicrobiia bacterium]|nr:DegV family protein [Acidimicrobiia bacterium]